MIVGFLNGLPRWLLAPPTRNRSIIRVAQLLQTFHGLHNISTLFDLPITLIIYWSVEKIIVDIDNTLWDLAPVLYGRMREVSPDLPPRAEWPSRNHWRRYMTMEMVLTILDGIHMEQDKFAPFDDASGFLSALKRMGFYIIIASHRTGHAIYATTKWLEKNGLSYDQIHLSYDKTVLFGDCWGVIDDNVEVLNKAEQTGIIRAGLRTPWNMGEEHPLFDNLIQILKYIEGQRGN